MLVPYYMIVEQYSTTVEFIIVFIIVIIIPSKGGSFLSWTKISILIVSTIWVN